jgi:hypothetical protein
MDVRDVGPEQVEPVERLDHREPTREAAHRHVHCDRDAELAGELPFRRDHVVDAEPGASRGEAHCEQTVVRGEVRVPDALDVVARNPDLALEPVVGKRRVGAAVGVLRPDARLLEPADGGVRVFRRVVDVRPVDECRDPGVQAFERAGQVARVDVVRCVDGRERVEDFDEIVVERRIGRTAADGCLPRVAVGVDEAGNDDLSGAIDHLGVRLDGAVDRGDLVVFDQDVARAQVADVGVHGEHVATTEQDPVGHDHPFVAMACRERPLVRG